MAQVKRFLSGKKFRIFAHLNFRIRTSEFCDYKYISISSIANSLCNPS